MADPTPHCLVELCRAPWDGVLIPIVQRDYAQGRPEPDAAEVRERFLEALRDALDQAGAGGPTLDLDFVYGYEMEHRKRFVPIDGQQRLTTLFLLHWYLAIHDGERADFLTWASDAEGGARFNYAVRTSSDDFLRGLVQAEIDLQALLAPDPDRRNALSNTLRNEHWYFRTWQLDPTVRSCLVMLDSIHGVFGQTTGFYRRLVPPNPAITFRFLDLNRFGLGDELYIKMNARGRALTSFEVFKSEVEKYARSEPSLRGDSMGKLGLPLPAYLELQFDTTWLHLFWAALREEHRSDSQEGANWTRKLDPQMLNVLRVLAIILHPGVEETGEAAELVEKRLEELHSGVITSFNGYRKQGAVHAGWVRGTATLLDLWSGADGAEGLKTFLESSKYFDERKAFRQVREDRRRKHNESRKPRGSLTYAELIRFAAYCVYLLAGHDIGHFNDWMRVLSNLAENSPIDGGDDLRRALRGLRRLLEDSGGRVLGHLAAGGKVDGFLQQQVREERLKAQLMLHHKDWRALLERAELHTYLLGQIEFLLDFSGILGAWLPTEAITWGEQEDANYRAAFGLMLRRAEAVFGHPDGGLTELGEFRFERALLCFGDYALRPTRQSAKRSLGMNAPESQVSWKILLRADLRNDRLREQRAFLGQLFETIDPDDLPTSLDRVIAAGVADEENHDADWRQALIHQPVMLRFCRQRWLLLEWDYDAGNERSIPHVLLVAEERRGAWHGVDIWDKGIELQEAQAAGKLEPFSQVVIEAGAGSVEVPRIELWLPKKRKASYVIHHRPGRFQMFERTGGKEALVLTCDRDRLIKEVTKLAHELS